MTETTATSEIHTNETTKLVFEMRQLTREQVEIAERGLATFKALAESTSLEDFVDAVARFTTPLELPEALAQVLTDLQALQKDISIRAVERDAAEKGLRESLKPYFEAVATHAARMDERLGEARRNIKAAEFAKNLAEDLRNQRAHASAIREAEDRADVAGAEAAFERLLAEANSDRAAIALFQKTLNVDVLPPVVLAIVALAQPVEA